LSLVIAGPINGSFPVAFKPLSLRST